jgi:hypothetical protein
VKRSNCAHTPCTRSADRGVRSVDTSSDKSGWIWDGIMLANVAVKLGIRVKDTYAVDKWVQSVPDITLQSSIVFNSLSTIRPFL